MIKVLIKGPILSRSGYGEHARLVFRSLMNSPDRFDVYVIPIEWGMSNWPTDFNDPEIKMILNCMNKMQHSNGKFDVSMQVTVPTEWERIADVNIGVTAGIETDKVSPEWLQAINTVDSVIVVSEHAKTGIVNTKYQGKTQDGSIVEVACETPVEVIGYPVRNKEDVKINLGLKTSFNFYTVAQISPRKNVGKLFEWFMEEFQDDDDVGLVAKLHTNNNSYVDFEQTKKKVSSWSKRNPNKKCKIYLIHGNMSDEEMSSLNSHPGIKAFITTTHGEGYGLPIFEAAYCGLPVVAPAWSGQVDFLYAPVKNEKSGRIKKAPLFSKIKFDIKEVDQTAVWQGVINPDTKWCYPDKNSFQKQIRNLKNTYDHKKKIAEQLKDHLHTAFSEEVIYKKYADLVSKSSKFDDEIDDLFSQLTIE